VKTIRLFQQISLQGDIKGLCVFVDLTVKTLNPSVGFPQLSGSSNEFNRNVRNLRVPLLFLNTTVLLYGTNLVEYEYTCTVVLPVNTRRTLCYTVSSTGVLFILNSMKVNHSVNRQDCIQDCGTCLLQTPMCIHCELTTEYVSVYLSGLCCIYFCIYIYGCIYTFLLQSRFLNIKSKNYEFEFHRFYKTETVESYHLD
jgi:hypothetical protein